MLIWLNRSWASAWMKERRSPSRPRNSGIGTAVRGGFQRAGGTHPEHIDDLALGKRLLEAVLVEIEVDPLQLVGLPGVVERQFQQLELVFVVEIVDRSAGDLDGERLCLCQQWQAQAQPDEPFHALISCRIRDLPGV